MSGKVTVEPGQGGGRLDAFLAEQVPEVSRSQWKALILDGAVSLNGSGSKPNHRLKVGDAVAWAMPEETPDQPVPEDIPLIILHEDESILVLNKPPGLVVHPAAGHAAGTLVNALLFHHPLSAVLERAGVVHRLDKDTSGVMVVAKTGPAMIELQRQFKARETEKEYLALVWGNPRDRGQIETRIGRHPVHRQKMAVLKQGGRSAVSSYETLERFGHAALVRVVIKTGRTHQIRVHMAYSGCPIVGDTVYGRSRKGRLPEPPARQMLHASRLIFTHPDSGKRLSFDAPLFDDMDRLLNCLRAE